MVPDGHGAAAPEEPYRRVLEHLRVAAAVVGEGGVVLYANPRLAELLSVPRETIVGTRLAAFVAGNPPEGWLDPGDAGGAIATVELDLLDGPGPLIPVRADTSALEVEGRRLVCVTFTDLTVQRAHEAEIALLEHGLAVDSLRFTAVVNGLQEGVLVQDSQGRVLEANQRASEILGIPLDRLVTEPPSPPAWQADTINGGPASSDQAPGRRALAQNRPVLGVMLGLTRGDEHVWVEVNSVPLRLPGEAGGQVVISSFRDVTTRLAADREIQFQALLLNTAGQAIIAVDLDGIVLFWNQHAEQMYGWPADEALGQSIADLVLLDEMVDLAPTIVEAAEAGRTWTADQSVRRRDGTVFPVFVTSTPVFDDDNHLVAMITVATDISDRKRAEDHARRLSAIVDSSSDAIVGMTLDGTVTTWNPGAATLLGYSADEAVGQHISMFAPSNVPGHVLQEINAAPDLSMTDVESACLTKQGALVQVSLSVSPILDDQGRPTGLSCIARDITDRIAMEHAAEENRRTLLVAQHAAELEAIGHEEASRANRAKSEFLSRMSHELRTPLNAVLGFGQILRMGNLTDDQRESVEFICAAGEHLLDLINDVLDITRIEAGALRLSLERVQVDEVLSTALSLIRPQADLGDVSMPTATGVTDDVYVYADRQRLLQVMLNLLSNAVKYNRPGGRVELTCESSGGTVSIAVADTGVGIGRADLGKIFTPFERLGAEGTQVEGAGVGLALSLVLSHEMGGSLTVSSHRGIGSTFTLELPAGPVSAPVVEEHADTVTARPITPSSRPVTVLAIEDNVANIRLLERMMDLCDNSVLLTAIQGRLGLELATQHHPDLVLLDLHLPDIPGEQVLDRLRSDPATAGITVVICSGDASPRQRRECLDAGAAAYLTKPFDLNELLDIIERVRSGEPLLPEEQDTAP